jgi:hypothetical protein
VIVRLVCVCMQACEFGSLHVFICYVWPAYSAEWKCASRMCDVIECEVICIVMSS